MPPPARAALAIAVALGLGRPASAQMPQPRLQSVSRAGTQAGESVDVTVRGTDLDGVNALWFDHPGLRAFHLKGQTFRVVCATGVPRGIHDVRVAGLHGVSNPRAFVVGDRPEVLEQEPNNTPEQARVIAIGTVANGEIGATDADCFAFEGKKGQRVFLDLDAERIDSRLDATLRLFDPAGRELAESRDTFGADPFLDLALPVDGRYTVKVHDVVFGGSPDHIYRLTVHEGPHLDAIVPAVAAPGIPRSFTLIGRNLGGTPAPELTAADGRPLERKEVTLTPPAATLDPDYPTGAFVPSTAAPRQGFEYGLTTDRGTSNVVFVGRALDPVVAEREPNDDSEHAQVVTLPCDVSGTFGVPGDADVYRFTAKKGDTWWIEADAERVGSPADPMFVVQKVVANGTPQDLASGEDLPDAGAGARFQLATVDAALRWQVPEDGTYQVVVNDLYASQRGEARLTYRLNIRPERPDFRLFLVPNNPSQSDAVVVRAGGRTSAFVVAMRLDGFAGPIHVAPRDLPPGVSCEPVVIAAGQTLAPVVFTAAENAKGWLGTATLVGRSRFGDRKDELQYTPGASMLGPDVTHEALGGGIVWPPGNPQAPAFAAARLTRGFVLGVLGEPAPFQLRAEPSRWIVARGHQLPVEVSVTRREGFAEAIALTQTELPPNFPAVAATIAKDAQSTTVNLIVPKSFPLGNYTFVMRGTGAFALNKKAKVSLVEPSNPITVTVRAAPLTLAVKNKGGALKAGASLEVEVSVGRQGGFTGDVRLSLNAPSALKLTAEPAVVPQGQTTAKLVIRAASDSPAGAAAGVTVRAGGVVNGETIEVDEPLAVTINK